MHQSYKLRFSLGFSTIFVFLFLVTPKPVTSWYYNCVVESAARTDDCLFLDVVVTKNTNADDIYFPPTNISFLRSNFSSFSSTLGRRLAKETETVKFLNCSMPAFSVPVAVKSVGIYLSNMEIVYANYLLDNQLEHLTIFQTRVTNIRFVEVLTRLRTLIVRYNPIRFVNFERFRNLTDLEVINLSDNRISNIHPGFEPVELPKLQELYLNNNSLIELDCRLWFFPTLYVIKLHMNFLKSVNVKELNRSTPSLSEVSLSKNLWNCQRLNVILNHFKNQNVYVEDSANLSCYSFNRFEYLSFTEQDNFSQTKQMASVLNSTASENYQNFKSQKLATLLKRNEALGIELTGMEKRIEELFMKYNVLKSWIHAK